MKSLPEELLVLVLQHGVYPDLHCEIAGRAAGYSPRRIWLMRAGLFGNPDQIVYGREFINWMDTLNSRNPQQIKGSANILLEDIVEFFEMRME